MKAAKLDISSATGPSIESDERHLSDVDAFIARNRDALNASIRASRAEVGKAITASRTIDAVIKDARLKHGQD